jgi:hypothetical protein
VAFALCELFGLAVLCWAITFAVLGLGATLVAAPASPVLLLAARLCAAVGAPLALLGLAGELINRRSRPAAQSGAAVRAGPPQRRREDWRLADVGPVRGAPGPRRDRRPHWVR